MAGRRQHDRRRHPGTVAVPGAAEQVRGRHRQHCRRRRARGGAALCRAVGHPAHRPPTSTRCWSTRRHDWPTSRVSAWWAPQPRRPACCRSCWPDTSRSRSARRSTPRASRCVPAIIAHSRFCVASAWRPRSARRSRSTTPSRRSTSSSTRCAGSRRAARTSANLVAGAHLPLFALISRGPNGIRWWSAARDPATPTRRR